MTISKSKFVTGVQCLKRLYWQVYAPELAAQPDASAEAKMEQGREVGLLARQLFPGGVEVRGEGGLERAIRTTRELIANGTYLLPPIVTSTSTGTWSLRCPHSGNDPTSTDPNRQHFGTNT
jgi:hypothetical protein